MILNFQMHEHLDRSLKGLEVIPLNRQLSERPAEDSAHPLCGWTYQPHSHRVPFPIPPERDLLPVLPASEPQAKVWPVGFWRRAPGRILAEGGETEKRENSQTWKWVRQDPKGNTIHTKGHSESRKSTELRVRTSGVLTAIYWICDLRSSHLTFLKWSHPRA